MNTPTSAFTIASHEHKISLFSDNVILIESKKTYQKVPKEEEGISSAGEKAFNLLG